ncbi:MAG: glycosyltransferase family 2 protein [Anaeromyxobacteraceae bacterium]
MSGGTASGSAAPQAPSTAALELELSIVMPCLNESETIAKCIRKARGFLESEGIHGEIVIGDNGSTDGSQEIASSEGARVIHVPIRGYGAALYHAILAAKGRYVVMGDADDSYDFSELGDFLDRLREGFDLVMGNRFEGGIQPGAMPWKNRYLGNPVLSGLGRVLFSAPVRDFHCGLRAFNAASFKSMDLRTTGMEFASEMVIKATLLGMKVTEVPTTLSKDGRSRPPHLRPWRDGWRHLRFMLLYSPRWLFLYPGLLLVVAGTATGGWLLPGPRNVGHVELDVHTLLYCSLGVLIGTQMIVFGALATLFAAIERLIPARATTQFLSHFKLEWGLLLGLVLIALGLGGSISAVLGWRSIGFGPLSPSHTLRAVIPSTTAGLVGLELVLASFFVSILKLKLRPLESEQEEGA